jgi:hypothetical protein
MKEYTPARTLNKKLFAAVIDATMLSISDLPPELKGTWQAVDLTGGQDGLLLKTQLPGSHEEKHVLARWPATSEAWGRKGRARC